MDLRQLEIIRAIADSGSFTAAGEKLHVSQSAISRQILLLEDELGEPVFHRIGRRIRITPAGESLLHLSNRVFQDLEETVAAIFTDVAMPNMNGIDLAKVVSHRWPHIGIIVTSGALPSGVVLDLPAGSLRPRSRRSRGDGRSPASCCGIVA